MANFLWGAAGQKMTPDQVAEQRKIAQALISEASDTSPVGHWTAALNRGLQGWLGGRQAYQAREAENAGRADYEAMKANRATFGGADPVAAALSGGAGGAQSYTAPAEAAAIREGLIARGLPDHVADGFIMNFQDESGLNPGINEISPLIPGSRGGFGLYQLTGPRRTAYEQFASQRGVDPSDVDAQLDWLMYELQGPEAKAAQSIFSAGNAGEAGAAIVNNFLRPAAEHRQSRASRYLGGASAPAVGGGNRSQEIAALLSHDWVPQGERAALQAQMQQTQAMELAQYNQQLQAQDPARQLALEKAQLELDQMRNPTSDYDQRAAAADQFGLQGDARQAFILTGDVPGLGGSNTPAQIQELQWRAEQAGLTVGTPEYQKFILNGGRAESNRPAAVEAAHQLALMAGYEPDTPEYQEFIRTKGAGEVAAAQVAGKTAAEMEIAAPAEINSADDALRYIDEIRNHPGRKAGTGASSYAWNWIPGTEAYSFANRVKQLGGGAFLTAIGEMQGMGALSNQEGQTAKDAIARLDTAVTEDEFIAALDDYQRIIQRGKERAQKRLKVTDAVPDASNGADESDEEFLKRMGLQ